MFFRTMDRAPELDGKTGNGPGAAYRVTGSWTPCYPVDGANDVPFFGTLVDQQNGSSTLFLFSDSDIFLTWFRGFAIDDGDIVGTMGVSFTAKDGTEVSITTREHSVRQSGPLGEQRRPLQKKALVVPACSDRR